MSSRLKTVRRVAQLRETGARAAAGAARRAVGDAEMLRDSKLDELSRTTLSSPGAGLVAEGARRARLAVALVEAGAAIVVRVQEQEQAVQHYVAASRTTHLVSEVCARHDIAAEATKEAATQRLMDDLAGTRKNT